ncbi:MAG: hypothetical protein GF411_01385 [Candidatus Lokiarchaeota archaeon]|nr:hypothetical protein [Candidatus Lokiarchaeota archaeon]
MPKVCSECGDAIPSATAKHLQKQRSDDRLVCPKCVSKLIKSKELHHPMCEKCREPIDPALLQAYAVSGHNENMPSFCEKCGKKGSPKLPPKRLYD